MRGQSGNNIKYSAINRKLEDLCAITIKIKYTKCLRQQNISYFGSLKRANREGQREEERRTGRRRRSQEERYENSKVLYGFYDFWYGYDMESKDLMVLYGILGNFMSSKPRV